MKNLSTLLTFFIFFSFLIAPQGLHAQCVPPAQPTAITGSTPVCPSSSQTYSLVAVAGATSYTWTLPSGWTGTSTTNSITVTTGTAGGTIQVTANSACGSSTPQTLAVTVPSLNDGVACTVDGCTNGVATHTPNNAVCDDGNACNGAETCHPTNGCQAGAPPAITGSTPVCPSSSQTYSVVAVAGATSYTWTLPSGWTGTSTTNSITVTTGTAGGTIQVTANSACGSSTPQTLAVTVPSLNDGVACTVDGCTNGVATHTPNNAVCDDGNACNGAETCHPTNGCQAGAPPAITGSTPVCPSSSQTYSVVAVAGATSYTWTLPSGWTGTSTTNSITVTTGTAGGTIQVTANSACGSSTPQTLAVTVPSLNDGVACTVDGCTNGVATHTPNNAVCDDGNACNGAETCHPTLGCQAGSPLNCDDSNPSTTDSCDPLIGCLNTPTATAGQWTGNTSALWNAPGNWSDGIVPGAGDEATIPTTPIGGNMPTVNIANAAVGDITIEAGATLTITAGNALTVDGVLTNNGTVNVQNSAALVQTTGSTLAGSGTYNVTRTGSSVYDFWSSPITNASPSLLGGTVYQYNPANGTNDIGDDGYDPAWGTPGGTMTVGRGYAALGAGTRTFTGTVNNGNLPRAVEYHDYTVSGMPFNLIGNPYPSGINASDFINANSALVDDGVVYLWDDPSTGTYTGGDFATRNLSGGAAGGGGNIPGPVIGSHQGFKIRATADGTVNFTNAMRTATNPAMLFRQDEDGLQRLWLSATSEAMRYNQTMVAFSPDGSEGRDWGFDAPKMSATGPLRVYSMLDDEPMAIQTYGMLGLSTRTVPLGLHSNASVIVTIAIDSVEGLQGRDIVLEDRYYGLFHDLRQGDYTFRAAEGTHHGRLFLRIGEGEATGIAEAESGMVAYIADGYLHLRTTHAMTGTVALMDMGGRQVLVESRVNMGPEVLRLDVAHLAKGVYAVRISDQTSTHTAKVIH